MGYVIGSASTLNNTASYTIVNVPSPGVLGPTVVNNYTTLSIPAYWRALNFKSANMASFPRSVRKDGVDAAHRLNKILQRRPNCYQSPTMLFRTWFFHQAHYSNGFLEIERDSLFNPCALHNRPPELVSPFRYMDDNGQVSGWYWVGGTNPRIVAAADMMHLTGLSYDGLSGLNPCWIHAETFERGRLMDRYITRFLVKGSVVRGSIELPAGLTLEQQEAIVEDLRKFRGADSEDDLLTLSGGAKFNNAGTSNNESQLVQLHDLSDIQIAQLTDVHPYFLYSDKNGKYNKNAQQAGEDIVRYLFRLLIEQTEDELLKLLTEAEQDAGLTIHIDPAALIRGDTETEGANVVVLKAAGIISGNEARTELGYPTTDNPEDDKLKTSGDTSPPKPKGKPGAEPPAPDPDEPQKQSYRKAFGLIIDEAARRVETKTAKASATTYARKKTDPEGVMRWGNIFAGEQEAYVVDAIKPILEAFSLETDAAAKAGSAYASQLRGHFARLNRNETSSPPELKAIVLAAMEKSES